MTGKTILLAAALALAPLAAEAQSYRCVGKDGKKYYGQAIPQQCLGQPIEEISKQGRVVRRIDAEADEKMRTAKEAEAAKKREEDAIAKEESRRNRALLATYTSERDIEEARARALADNDKLVKEVEARIDAIRKRQAGYAKEMEFYAEGAKPADKGKKGGGPAAKSGGAKPPPKLLEDMNMAEVDLKLQEDALAGRKKQVDIINAKYNEDKSRFLRATGRK